MSRMLSYDSPFMNFMTKVANLMWANFLFIVCSLPVLTFGASSTSLYYITIKVIKNEEVSVTKAFFKSFKENFKQSTIIWLGLLIGYIFFGFDLYIFYKNPDKYNLYLKMIVLLFVVLWSFVFMHIFPYISHFKSSTKDTIKNSLVIALTHIVKTVFMIAISIFPVVWAFGQYKLVPFVFLIAFAFCAFVNSIWLVKIYDEIEKNYSLIEEYHDRFEEFESDENSEVEKNAVKLVADADEAQEE